MASDFGLTPELVVFVKQAEGWVGHPYRDQVGNPTIGYGHLLDSMDHAPITLDQGNEILMQDLRAKRDALLALSPSLHTASEQRVAALVDFVFNLGEGAYEHSTLRKYVDGAEWAAAAAEITKWCHAGGRVLPELVARRNTESHWLAEG
jgi:lysozyme